MSRIGGNGFFVRVGGAQRGDGVDLVPVDQPGAVQGLRLEQVRGRRRGRR